MSAPFLRRTKSFFCIDKLKGMKDIQIILCNLTTLGQLKQNDKLQTEGEVFTIYVPTVMRGMMRFIYGETREVNLRRINDCIQGAKDFVTHKMAEFSNESAMECITFQMKIQRHDQHKMCVRIIEALQQSLQGFENLEETYKDDASLVSRMRNMKSDICDFCEYTLRCITTTKTIDEM